MALPDSCELTPTHLIFWELASEPQSADTAKLYEILVALWPAPTPLRPLGAVEVVRHPFPQPGRRPGAAVGQPSARRPEAGRTYRESGYVLCELRLPVQPMGAPVYRGISATRPVGS